MAFAESDSSSPAKFYNTSTQYEHYWPRQNMTYNSNDSIVFYDLRQVLPEPQSEEVPRDTATGEEIVDNIVE